MVKRTVGDVVKELKATAERLLRLTLELGTLQKEEATCQSHTGPPATTAGLIRQGNCVEVTNGRVDSKGVGCGAWGKVIRVSPLFIKFITDSGVLTKRAPHNLKRVIKNTHDLRITIWERDNGNRSSNSSTH